MDWHVSPRVWRADTLHWFCIEREWRKDWGDKRKKASARAWVGLNRERLWSFHTVRPSSCQQALTSSNQLSFLPLLAMWLNLTFTKEKKKEIHPLPAFSGLCSFSLSNSRNLRLAVSSVGCSANRSKLELHRNVGQFQSSGSKPGDPGGCRNQVLTP